jgi:oxalate decarboxylase/phosphoglucose isomerase-like protein (cupin superfamily)
LQDACDNDACEADEMGLLQHKSQRRSGALERVTVSRKTEFKAFHDGARKTGQTVVNGTEGYPQIPATSVSTVENLDFNPLAKDSDFVIDILERESNQGGGGTIQAGESPDLPALLGQGMAFSLFTLEKGGENLPHYHPRATEFLYLIKGGPLEVGFTDTTGTLHLNKMVVGQATLFPRALMHFQRNLGDGQTQYLSVLNSENPGVMSFPRVFYTMPDQALSNALREPIDEIRKDRERVIPPSLLPGNKNYDGAAGDEGNAPVPQEGVGCPEGCYWPQCDPGRDPYEGWKPLSEDNVCHYYCSQEYSGKRFCGDGPPFKTNDYIDCTGCASH